MNETFFYLGRAFTCVNCSATFSARPTCPACTSSNVQSTETYCAGRKDLAQRMAFEAKVREEINAMVKEMR